MTNLKPETWNLNPAPHQRSSRAQLERTPLPPTLTPQQLTNITRKTFSKLERSPASTPSSVRSLCLPTFRIPHSAFRTFSRRPSSAAPNSSSTLPNRSSHLPKCSRSAQLEPFAGDPLFATSSRQTPYNFAFEKSASHLSTFQPLAKKSCPACHFYPSSIR